MRKGFTLLELLGIIILLGVIILVAVPSLIQSNKTAEIKDKDEFTNTINNACTLYLQVHSEEYSELLNIKGTKKTIEADKLIKEGFLKGTLKNPNDKSGENTLEEENGKITAENNDGQITCTYKYNE